MMTHISTPVREGFAPLAAHVSRAPFGDIAGGVTPSYCASPVTHS
jgi:hypothetical protein